MVETIIIMLLIVLVLQLMVWGDFFSGGRRHTH
jgi:hypothetical protein